MNLFSPKWNIQREEITDSDKFNNLDFEDSMKVTHVEVLQGELNDARKRCKELLENELNELDPVVRFSKPPLIKYHYKLVS